MNTINAYQIEVDAEIYEFLKSKAEPFIDTPNSVLHRFLPLNKSNNNLLEKSEFTLFPILPAHIPSALAQILEMVYLVKKIGLNRIDATRKIATNRKISTQAVIDKYTRQLGKKVSDIDEYLFNNHMSEFEIVLTTHFNKYTKTIENIFEQL